MKDPRSSIARKIRSGINKETVGYVLLYLAVEGPFFFISFYYPGFGGPVFLAVLLAASAYIGGKLGDLERSLKLLFASCVFACILIFVIAMINLPAFVSIFQKAPGWFRILDPDYLLYFTAEHFGFVIFGIVIIFSFMAFIVGLIGNVIGFAISGLIWKKQ